MIILDTNVVSEPMRVSPDPQVVDWLNVQNTNLLFFTATSFAEVLTGIARLPAGRRKSELSDAFEGVIQTHIGPRILPFDARAAVVYAQLVARARGAGFNIAIADAQIAAIALAHGFTVATRGTQPFEASGVPVVNPWLPAC